MTRRKSVKRSLHEDSCMIGDKGFKDHQTFKDGLRYKIPRITIIDVANEIAENRKRKNIEKELGK